MIDLVKKILSKSTKGGRADYKPYQSELFD